MLRNLLIITQQINDWAWIKIHVFPTSMLPIYTPLSFHKREEKIYVYIEWFLKRGRERHRNLASKSYQVENKQKLWHFKISERVANYT